MAQSTIEDNARAKEAIDKRASEHAHDAEEAEEQQAKRRKQAVADLVSGDAMEEGLQMRTVKVGIKLSAVAKPKTAMSAPTASVFASSAEDEQRPMRSFVPLDYTEEEMLSVQQAASAAAAAADNEKKLRQKQIVDQIPTEREALFAYPIDWELVQSLDLGESSLRPWIVKKMVEYLGQEERTLIDFIIAKMANRCDPSQLLGELEDVLDEDAEQFVIKLWRMLIFSLIAAASS